MTKSRHDAEDAAQATFLTLAIQARTGDEIRHLGPWLQRVARRVALDQEKAKRRRKRREDNHHIVNGTTGHATPHKASLDQLELRHLINEELQQLPAKYRMPLILHYFGGLSREQMAAELKCKPATLGVRLFRARDMLGKRLAKKGIALPAVALPLAIAMVVRESVEQHGVIAMAATATQIADAAARVSIGLTPQMGTVSSAALALADVATHQLVLRRVKAIVAAAAIGASALAAGGGQIVHRIQDGTLSLQSLFDVSGYFRSLTAPGLPQLRVDASSRLDSNQHYAANFPAELRFSGDGSLQLLSVSLTPNPTPSNPLDRRTSDFQLTMIGGQSPAAVRTPAPLTNTPARPAAPADPITLHTPTRVAAADTTQQLTSTLPIPTPSSQSRSSASDSPGYAFLPLPTDAADFAGYSTIQGLGRFSSTGFSSSTTPTSLSLKPVATLARKSSDLTPQPGPFPAAASSLGSSSPTYDSIANTPVPPLTTDGNVLIGYGKPEYTGHFDMSGVVVADGHGRPRTLDFSALASAYNSIPNAPTGINGWYAQHGGKLTLPPLELSAGASSTVTFGDAPESSDPTNRLDLVNAARFTFHNITIADRTATLTKPDATATVANPHSTASDATATLSQPSSTATNSTAILTKPDPTTPVTVARGVKPSTPNTTNLTPTYGVATSVATYPAVPTQTTPALYRTRVTDATAPTAATATTARISISLLAPDRAEIPTLPAGLAAISIWSLSPDASVSYSSFDFVARYALPGTDLSGPLAGLSVYYSSTDNAGLTAWLPASFAIDPATRHVFATGIPETNFVALFAKDDLTDPSISALGLLDDSNLLAAYQLAANTPPTNTLPLPTYAYTSEALTDQPLVATDSTALTSAALSSGDSIISASFPTPDPAGLTRAAQSGRAFSSTVTAPSTSPGSPSATIVPEPAALSFLAAAPLLLSRRRRA